MQTNDFGSRSRSLIREIVVGVIWLYKKTLLKQLKSMLKSHEERKKELRLKKKEYQRLADIVIESMITSADFPLDQKAEKRFRIYLSARIISSLLKQKQLILDKEKDLTGSLIRPKRNLDITSGARIYVSTSRIFALENVAGKIICHDLYSAKTNLK